MSFLNLLNFVPLWPYSLWHSGITVLHLAHSTVTQSHKEAPYAYSYQNISLRTIIKFVCVVNHEPITVCLRSLSTITSQMLTHSTALLQQMTILRAMPHTAAAVVARRTQITVPQGTAIILLLPYFIDSTEHAIYHVPCYYLMEIPYPRVAPASPSLPGVGHLLTTYRSFYNIPHPSAMVLVCPWGDLNEQGSPPENSPGCPEESRPQQVPQPDREGPTWGGAKLIWGDNSPRLAHHGLRAACL